LVISAWETFRQPLQQVAQLFINNIIPTITAVTGFLAHHKTVVQAVAVTVGVLWLAWKSYQITQAAIILTTKAMIAAQILLNAVLDANPILLIVTLLAALAAGLIYAYKHSETFRKIVDSTFHVFVAVVDWAMAHWKLLLILLTGGLGVLVVLFVSNFTKIKNFVTAAFNAIVTAGQVIINWFRLLPGRIWDFIKGLPGTLLNLGINVVHSFVNGVISVAGTIWNWFKSLPQKIWDSAVQGPAGMLFRLGANFINWIVEGFKNAVSSVVNWFKDLPGKILGALGISSPPAWAISAGEWIIKGVLKGAGSLGKNLVKFFGGLAGKAWQGITKIPSFIGKLGQSIGGGFIPGGPGSSVPANVIAEHAYAASLFPSLGWSVAGQLDSLISLWNEESGWNPGATNASSGAYGIPQALPADKMASAGSDWRTNPATQIRWGLGYIKDRYGSPAAAWAFETSHTPNWYQQGAWNVPTNQLAFLHAKEMVIPSRPAEKFRSGDFGGITVAPGAVTVYAAAGMDERAVADQAFARLREWVAEEQRRAAKGGRA
jgi:uncharacterized membrane protein